MQASSISNFERKGGNTIKACFWALALLLLIELFLPAGAGPASAPSPLTAQEYRVVVVGDSRTQTLDGESISQGWDSGPSTLVFSLNGSHAETVARFAMDRLKTPPELLVICVSYSGHYASPHGSLSRLQRRPEWSSLVAKKVHVREFLRSRLALFLDGHALDSLKWVRQWVMDSARPPDKPGHSPVVDENRAPPKVRPLDLLAVHNQYRFLARRVVPGYRTRGFESILKSWKADGVEVVFVRLPVTGKLREIEEATTFKEELQKLASRAGIKFFDLNEEAGAGEFHQFMPDESHVWGTERRKRLSRQLGQLLAANGYLD